MNKIRQSCRFYKGHRQYASSAKRPLRACIIGSGPAGFYTAYRILQNLPSARIDIFESLPVPYGLARFGVAPDHPEVKNVVHKFDEIAISPNVRFFGNVHVGRDVSLPDLRYCYDALVFAYGASMNRRLNIPGEDLKEVISARSFVGWYNGLPEFSGHAYSTSLANAENAVIIGQGNVALDIARVLLSNVDELRKTDMADHALDALSRSRMKSVKIIGRRGPLQASFTIKEVRELINLPQATFTNSAQHEYKSILATETLQRPQRRLIELLAKQDPKKSARTWDINYLQSPKSFNATDGQLTSMTTVKNELISYGSRISAKATDQTHTIPTEMAFLSIGYQSKPLPGMSDIGIVFDTTRHILPNTLGRITSLDAVVPGAYCAGWAKLGPVGVIASTMRDAFETADSITQDWQSSSALPAALNEVESALDKLQGQVVDWSGWKRIETYEHERGSNSMPPRPAQKIVSVEQMLDIAHP